MAFRSFRHTADPQSRILDRIDGSADDTFGSSDAIAVAEVSVASGIPVAELAIEISEVRPDLSDAIAIAPTPVVPTAQDTAAENVRTARNSALGTDPVTWAEMDEVLTSLGVEP